MGQSFCPPPFAVNPFPNFKEHKSAEAAFNDPYYTINCWDYNDNFYPQLFGEVTWRGKKLLSDAELAEDGIEQIFRRRLADDFPDGAGGSAKLQRHEFQSQIRA
jgi:hypothetical protein